MAFVMFNKETTMAVKSDEYILMDYPTNNPITYHKTTTPVTLPKGFLPNKQEFRGVWITTIWNLDVPSYSSNHEEQFKAYHMQMFDNLEAYNMNAVVYQIRPKNDAFYPSTLNPWSRFLTGEEGKHPGWDPLKWLVEESHRRGIEFHAWFNPYRVFVDSSVHGKSIVTKHPEYVIPLGNGDEILNPGIPEVQQFIMDTVREVAENYDIDGVHFDDYFYPYARLQDYYDDKEFQKYNPNNLSRSDWRRENVNAVIRGVKELLTEVNEAQGKAIQFGVSPFGIWRTKTSDPVHGMNTAANLESYDTLYADSKRWVDEEWVDYIVPQLYFEFDYPFAKYADTLDWWANLVKGTDVNLVIGQAIYRYADSETDPWEDPNEIPNQLLYNSKFESVKGSIYFRYKFLIGGNANTVHAQNQLKDKFYTDYVLPPASKNVDGTNPLKPQNLSIEGNTLSWDRDVDAKAYYVYRYEEGQIATLEYLSDVIDIVWNDGDSTSITYVDQEAVSGKNYHYFVSAFDRANNESEASGISSTGETAEVVPVEDKTVLDHYQKTQQANNELKNAITRVQERLDAIHSYEVLVNQSLTDIDFINETIEEDLQKVTSLKAELDQLKDRLTNFQADLSAKKDLKTLESILKDLKEKQEELNTLYTAIDTNYQSIKTKFDLLETNYSTITQNSQSLNGHTTFLQGQNLNPLFEDLNFWKDVLQADRNDANPTMQAQIDALVEKLYTQSSVESYTQQISEAIATGQELVRAPRTIREKKQPLNSIVSNYESEFNSTKDTNSEIASQLLELNTQYETAIEKEKEQAKRTQNIILISSVVAGAVLLVGGFVLLKKLKK